jgi:hypothetical protein
MANPTKDIPIRRDFRHRPDEGTEEPTPGITELGCHPATQADMDGMYRHERAMECQTLCHPDILTTIASEGISLCSFSDWPDYGTSNVTR